MRKPRSQMLLVNQDCRFSVNRRISPLSSLKAIARLLESFSALVRCSRPSSQGSGLARISVVTIWATPDPWLLGREHRTKAEKDSNNLAIAFRELKPEILRFTENLAVWFTN